MIQVLKEASTDYHSFIANLTHQVRQSMGEGYTVQIHKVIKNNSLELDSLLVLKEGVNFAPNIYLMPYYESYLAGTTMYELVERLCTMYRHCSIPMIDSNYICNFNEIKDFIVYRLVNYDKNRSVLNTIPHMKYLDLAVTFHCMVRDDGESVGTIRITNEHINHWKIDLLQLFGLANINTIRMLPPQIRSMEEVMKEILDEDFTFVDNDINDQENSIEELIESMEDPHRCERRKMYVLSNRKGIHGASCLLYKDVIKKIANQLKTDLYILPSSIHEVIVVPSDTELNKGILNNMVEEINETQVPEDEVLSNNVYYYSREKNNIEI